MATKQSTRISNAMAAKQAPRQTERSRSPIRSKNETLPMVKNLLFTPPASAGGPVKTWSLTDQSKPVVAVIGNTLSAFEPSSPMEDSTRLTLTLRLPSGWDSVFDCFEACMFHEVMERSAEFFGRTVPEEELRDWYKPITKKQNDYPRNLRVKVNTQGQYRTRYWAADKQPMQPPATHAGISFNARIIFRGVWIGEDAFGIVCDCTDLQVVDDAAAACPF